VQVLLSNKRGLQQNQEKPVLKEQNWLNVEEEKLLHLETQPKRAKKARARIEA
jgi:hypothetical protein